MPRVLLILPTGTYRADEYLSAAERLGIEVAVASERAQALAATMGERFVEVPLDDPAEAARRIVAQARRDPRLTLAAVLGVDDQGLMAAAQAAAELGLRHSPPESVALTRDKAAMRAVFEAAGVPQADFVVVDPGDASPVAAAATRLGLPVVVKPCSLSGSRGVIRADTPEDAITAAERIRAILDSEAEPRGSPLLVEQFIPGPEVAVEGILRGGLVEIITVFDKPDPLDGPFFEETFYLSPSVLPEHLLDAVRVATEDAVVALGLTEGPFHAELRVPGAVVPPAAGILGGIGLVLWPEKEPNPTQNALDIPRAGAPPAGGLSGRGAGVDAVKVLEVAARTIGGRCSKAMRLEDGSSLEELVIANALGLAYPPPRLAAPCGILMIPIPASGTLLAIDGVEDARALPGITGVEITIPIGRPVKALPEGDRYLGFVFASGETRSVVEAALREAQRLLVVHVGEPVAPVEPVEPAEPAEPRDTLA